MAIQAFDIAAWTLGNWPSLMDVKNIIVKFRDFKANLLLELLYRHFRIPGKRSSIEEHNILRCEMFRVWTLPTPRSVDVSVKRKDEDKM